MMRLQFSTAQRKPPRVLCFGAHCDDIEIGCGATLMQIARDYPRARFQWVVLCSTSARAAETRTAAKLFLGSRLRARDLQIAEFRDGFLPAQFVAAKELFEQVRRQHDPDLIFTHYGRDAHQDHRIVSELTWNTFRNHSILEYEIPKYDGDLSAPNFYCALNRGLAQRKASFLLRAFRSQRGKDWFSADLFTGLTRLRGVECRSASGHAEAFYARKVVV